MTGSTAPLSISWESPTRQAAFELTMNGVTLVNLASGPGAGAVVPFAIATTVTSLPSSCNIVRSSFSSEPRTKLKTTS